MATDGNGVEYSAKASTTGVGACHLELRGFVYSWKAKNNVGARGPVAK